MEQKIYAENPEAVNLRRLIKSGILKNFIKETKGLWGHIAWRELCSEIEEKATLRWISAQSACIWKK